MVRNSPQTFLNVTDKEKRKHALYSYRKERKLLQMIAAEEQTFAYTGIRKCDRWKFASRHAMYLQRDGLHRDATNADAPRRVQRRERI